jgi:hypothetical protein
MKDDKAQFTGVMLYDKDRAVLTQVAKDHGLSMSAAVRMIVAEWVRLRAEKDGYALPQVETASCAGE